MKEPCRLPSAEEVKGPLVIQGDLLKVDLLPSRLRDQVARRPDGGLSVLRGQVSQGTFGGRELGFGGREVKLALPQTEPPWVVDLDGDGKDELILEPFGGDDAASRTLRVVGAAR